MAQIVIYARNADPKHRALSTSPQTLGRAPDCDIQLGTPAVSRHHATFERQEDGRWVLFPAKQDALIIYNGRFVSGDRVSLGDGDELLVGDQLVVFFEKRAPASAETRRDPFTTGRCTACGFEGKLPAGSHETCPKCGSKEIRRIQSNPVGGGDPRVQQGTTAYMDMNEISANIEAIKTAHKTHLVKTSGRNKGKKRKLSTGKPTLVGRGERAAFAAPWFTIGSGFKIHWDGERFLLESESWWPPVEVNGRPVKMGEPLPVRPGDKISHGGNHFELE